MKLRIKKTHHDAIVPRYANPGDACFDLHSLAGGKVAAGDSLSFRTGIAVEIPDGHVMLIYSRSGHGFKNGLRLVNCVGVIDAGYRNEIAVKLHNDSPVDFEFPAGARIAQAMVVPIPSVEFEVVDDLSESVRGMNGIGSTGI